MAIVTPPPSRWRRLRTRIGSSTAANGAYRLIGFVLAAVLVIGVLFLGLIAVKWIANTDPVQAAWGNPFNDDEKSKSPSDEKKDDDEEDTSPPTIGAVESPDGAAALFGGKKSNWTEVKGSKNAGWIYSGARIDLDIPEGYRVDYVAHSCAEAKGEGGTYGPAKANVRLATVWDVGDETTCPDDSKYAQAKAEAEKKPKVGDNPAGGNPPTGGTFSLGCGDKNVGAVQSLLGISVVCLGTEYDAYTWRSVPIKVDATCPEGWICTLHLAEGDKIIVTETPGKYSIVAGTFRRKTGYPSGDAVHNACELLIKEKTFGASQNPKFDVFPHGFTCDGTKLTKSDSTAGTVGTTDLTKLASAELVAKIVGGSSSNWSELPGSNGKGWKYKGPSANLTVPPSSRIDHPNGSSNPGQSVTTSEATLWILS